MAENTNASIGFGKNLGYSVCPLGIYSSTSIEVYEDKFIVCLKTKVEIVIER